jgi:hypothetical protein
MSVNGEYNIVVHAPDGDHEAHLSLHLDGDHLTGEQCSHGECEPIEDGEVHGAGFSWTAEVASIHMPLRFTGQCDDDACSIISGDVKAGDAGSFHFTGTKA